MILPPLPTRATWMGLLILLVAAPVARAGTEDPWLGEDKALHAALSASIAGMSYGIGATLLEPPWQRALLGAGVALTAGGAKELLDLAGGGRASARDLAWDAAGVALGIGVALAVDYLVRWALESAR